MGRGTRGEPDAAGHGIPATNAPATVAAEVVGPANQTGVQRQTNAFAQALRTLPPQGSTTPTPQTIIHGALPPQGGKPRHQRPEAEAKCDVGPTPQTTTGAGTDQCLRESLMKLPPQGPTDPGQATTLTAKAPRAPPTISTVTKEGVASRATRRSAGPPSAKRYRPRGQCAMEHLPLRIVYRYRATCRE